MVQQKKTGINWVKHLLICLKLKKSEKFGWLSLFEIYFGRKANKLLSEGQSCDCTTDILEYIRPSAMDDQNQHKQVKTRGEMLTELTIKVSQRMLDIHPRKNIYNLYKRGRSQKKVDR